MKIEINLKEKEFKKAIIREIARQILTDENSNLMSFSWDRPMQKILIDKAHKLLSEDLEFDKKIKRDLRTELGSKRLIREISREIIKDKMEGD